MLFIISNSKFFPIKNPQPASIPLVIAEFTLEGRQIPSFPSAQEIKSSKSLKRYLRIK